MIIMIISHRDWHTARSPLQWWSMPRLACACLALLAVVGGGAARELHNDREFAGTSMGPALAICATLLLRWRSHVTRCWLLLLLAFPYLVLTPWLVANSLPRVPPNRGIASGDSVRSSSHAAVLRPSGSLPELGTSYK